MPFSGLRSKRVPVPHNTDTDSMTSKTRKLKCIVLGGANAGKTSILRRYFHGTFDIERMPTVGSDFYTGKIAGPNQITEKDDEEKKDSSSSSQRNKSVLSIQVWDTPGRERYAADRKPMYTAAFSDKFFRNADAALLVYDITSSTSFTHVLKWHADLMGRIRRLEATGERTRPFPVLIVANKMDILKNRAEQKSRQQAVVGLVKKRDVMGLAGKDFRGKDSRYEYSASPPNNSRSSKTSKTRGRFEISTYMGTGDQTSYLEAVLSNQVRGPYLESLLSTEDGSHPDKDMVLLWCMRNGLKHVEVSARDGTGIDELMSEMVKIALQSATQEITEPTFRVGGENRLSNDELDLHRRYAPKPRSWLSLPFNGCCKP